MPPAPNQPGGQGIAASRAFYEKLGFAVFGGDQAQNWLIMKQGPSLVGLFQDMFEQNMLTFNPGWDADARKVDPFVDVREWQRRLEAAGLALDPTADQTSSGPAFFMLRDPDGNPILVDQHR